MVSNDGVIYQRDLGQWTTDSVAAIKTFNPTPNWAVVLIAGTREPIERAGGGEKRPLQNAKVSPSTGP